MAKTVCSLQKVLMVQSQGSNGSGTRAHGAKLVKTYALLGSIYMFWNSTQSETLVQNSFPGFLSTYQSYDYLVQKDELLQS